MSRLSRLLMLLAVLIAVVAIPLVLSVPWAASAPVSAHPPGWGYPPPCAPLRACVVAPPAPAKLGTSRRMFDSVSLGEFPAHPFAVAGYTAGSWPTFGPLRARWPRAHAISIAISAKDHARCLDVEPGDATPAEAPGWVHLELRLHPRRPACVYSSYWEFVSEVRPLLAAAHIRRSQILEWDAQYGLGCPRLDRGFDATQCEDDAFGRNLDESVVTERFLRIAQPSYHPHAKQIKQLRRRVVLNQHRMARQHCGHLRRAERRGRARCAIERKRIATFSHQIKHLERL